MQKEDINQTHEEILGWIQKLRFKRKLFGGVDEADVLKKIEELNSLYEKALLAERARYDAMSAAGRGEEKDES